MGIHPIGFNDTPPPNYKEGMIPKRQMSVSEMKRMAEAKAAAETIRKRELDFRLHLAENADMTASDKIRNTRRIKELLR